MVDRPHLGVDGIFLDDDLLAAISPGGRLATLLDGLTDAAAVDYRAGRVTVVIDPQLLDELDRMTGPLPGGRPARRAATADDGDGAGGRLRRCRIDRRRLDAAGGHRRGTGHRGTDRSADRGRHRPGAASRRHRPAGARSDRPGCVHPRDRHHHSGDRA